MAKRIKRLEKGVESLKTEIKDHFERLDNELIEEDVIMARYHLKEIDKSLIDALEHKIKLLGEKGKYETLIKEYRNRLNKYKDKLGING